jgi:hypothetical protein
VFNDTWTFCSDGRWTNVTAAHSPPGRYGSAMAWDSALNALVLYGGQNATGSALNDTWAFGDGSWLRVALGPAPPARYGASLVGFGSDVLLAGGSAPNGTIFRDTWELGSGGWSQVAVGRDYSARYDAAAIDVGATPVLLGGETPLNCVCSPPYLTAGVTMLDALNVTVSPSASVAEEVGNPVPLSEQASGGVGPVTANWSLSNGTTLVGPTIDPTFTEPGNYTAVLTVTDRADVSVSIEVGIEVLPSLAVRSIQVTPTAVDAGQPIDFAVTTTGGFGIHQYFWQVPTGCASPDVGNFSCPDPLPSRTNVSVEVTDGLGGLATSSTIAVTVEPDLEIVGFAGSARALSADSMLELNVSTTGGTAPLSYSHAGLPPSCSPEDGPLLTCTTSVPGTYRISVTVVDAVGWVRNATAVVTVPPSSGPFVVTWLVLVGGTAATVAAAGAGVVLARRATRDSARRPS